MLILGFCINLKIEDQQCPSKVGGVAVTDSRKSFKIISFGFFEWRYRIIRIIGTRIGTSEIKIFTPQKTMQIPDL